MKTATLSILYDEKEITSNEIAIVLNKIKGIEVAAVESVD